MKKILLTLIFLMQGFSYSQSNAIRILKPKEIKFATEFNLRFEILNYNNEKIQISTENLNNSDFAYINTKQKGNILEISLIPFNVGISTFPSIDIYLNNYKITTSSFTLEISPLYNPKETDQLKDIFEIFSFLTWLKILLLLLIAIIIYLIYKKLKKEKTWNLNSTAFIDTRTPYQIAIDELEKLSLDMNVKEFYSHLSEIIRTYLEKEFIINATKMTTLDIIKNIKNQFTIDIAIKMREILENSDLAKFAKYEFEQTQLKQDLETTKEIINKLNSVKEERERKRKEEEMMMKEKEGKK